MMRAGLPFSSTCFPSTRQKQTTHCRLKVQGGKVISGYGTESKFVGFVLNAESGNPQSISEDVGKEDCLPAQIEHRRIRDSGTLSLVLRSQHDNLFRGGDRQWAEEPPIENAEYGGVDANAQGQRDHNNGSY